MRYLLNFIFDNLIPIIIVVSVAVRIITGMKNTAARGRGGAPPVSTPAVPRGRPDDAERDVWSRLSSDDDEDEEDEHAAAGEAAPLPPHEIRPLLMPASVLSGPPPPLINPGPVIARPFDPVASSIKPVAAEPDREGVPLQTAPGSRLLDRLNSLSPLRRAVVLTEILGPPKGLV
jgi:hypothetical protein